MVLLVCKYSTEGMNPALRKSWFYKMNRIKMCIVDVNIYKQIYKYRPIPRLFIGLTLTATRTFSVDILTIIPAQDILL